LIIVKHHGNIRRLMNGTEKSRFRVGSGSGTGTGEAEA